MTVDRPLVRLGDLLQIKHGWPFKSEQFSEQLTSRPIVVAIGNFQYTGGFRFDSTKTKEYLGEYPEGYELSPGDILLAMTCQTPGGEILGIPARVPADGRVYLHNQRLGRVQLRDPQRLDLDFFYWTCLWQKFNHHLFTTASGTKILHTSPGRIEAFRLPLPPLNEQRRIAAILGALDDKIELNRKMNRTLEEMAQAIFKSWFINFDGHDDLVDSELGPIPRGWNVGILSDVTEITMGQSPPGSTYNTTNDGLPFFQGATDFGEVFPTNRIYCNAPTRFAAEWDVLISVRAPVGRANLALERCAIGRGVGSIRSQARLYPAYNWSLIKSLSRVFDVFNGEGTVFGSINKKALHSIPIIVPQPSKVASFEDIAQPLISRLRITHKESITLTEIRDTLLPKLISGEIRVPEAETAISEVI